MMFLFKYVYRRLARFIWALVLFSGVFSSAMLVSAQPVNISGTIVTNGDVSEQYAFSADGRYAVFVADKDTDGKNELYSVRLSTGAITNISGGLVTVITGGLVTGGNVIKFRISPDSLRVVFVADKDTANVFELYSTPIGIAAPVKLSGALAVGGSVADDFQISPDSSRVVFRAETSAVNDFELYSTPISASARIALSGPFAVRRILEFQITPDSTRAVFRVDPISSPGFFYLYSASLLSGELVALAGALAESHSPISFQVSADSARVVFLSRDPANPSDQVFSSPIASYAPIRISGTYRGESVSVRPGSYQISPDSQRVVFLADRDTRFAYQLYSAPIASNSVEPTLISGPVLTSGDVFFVFRIAPNSARVVFGKFSTADGFQLFSTPMVGPASAEIKISATLVAGSFGDLFGGFQISPDSSRAVFRGRESTSSMTVSVYSTQISTNATAPVNLSGPFGGAHDALLFGISADSARVVLIGDLETNNVREVFSTPIDNGARIKLSLALPEFRDVLDFQLGPDAARVLYRAQNRNDVRSVKELYRVQTGGKALTMDFDADDRILAHTDLLMLVRRHLGASGTAITQSAVSANAAVTNAATIQSRIDAVRNDVSGINRPLDIDLNGSVGTATDMVMILRYALGFRGSAITQGAIGAPNTFPQRTDPTAIENHLRFLFTTYEVTGQG